jgi:hypothetical protein
MDYLALFAIFIGLFVYLFTKKPFALLVLGFGLGLLAGSIWAAAMITQALR